MPQIHFYRLLPKVFTTNELKRQYQEGFAEKQIYTQGNARQQIISFDVELLLTTKQATELFNFTDHNLINQHRNKRAKCQSCLIDNEKFLKMFDLTPVVSHLKKIIDGRNIQLWLIKKDNNNINLVLKFEGDKSVIIGSKPHPENVWRVNLHVKTVSTGNLYNKPNSLRKSLQNKFKNAENYFQTNYKLLTQLDENNFDSKGYKIKKDRNLTDNNKNSTTVIESVQEEAAEDVVLSCQIEIQTNIVNDKTITHIELLDEKATQIICDATEGLQVNNDHKKRALTIVLHALEQRSDEDITQKVVEEITKLVRKNIYRLSYYEMLKPQNIYNLFKCKTHIIDFSVDQGLYAAKIVKLIDDCKNRLAKKSLAY